jgi:hypothetical protein
MFGDMACQLYLQGQCVAGFPNYTFQQSDNELLIPNIRVWDLTGQYFLEQRAVMVPDEPLDWLAEAQGGVQTWHITIGGYILQPT